MSRNCCSANIAATNQNIALLIHAITHRIAEPTQRQIRNLKQSLSLNLHNVRGPLSKLPQGRPPIHPESRHGDSGRIQARLDRRLTFPSQPASSKLALTFDPSDTIYTEPAVRRSDRQAIVLAWLGAPPLYAEWTLSIATLRLSNREREILVRSHPASGFFRPS